MDDHKFLFWSYSSIGILVHHQAIDNLKALLMNLAGSIIEYYMHM